MEPLKQGDVPSWTGGLYHCGALRRRRCAGLDIWIVPAFCSGSAPHRAFKPGGVPNWASELFTHSILDRPYGEP